MIAGITYPAEDSAYTKGFLFDPLTNNASNIVPLTTVGAQSSPTGINDEEVIVGTILTSALESFPFWTCTPQAIGGFDAKPAKGAPHKTR